MHDDEPLVAESRDVRDQAVEWADRRAAELARGNVLDLGCGVGRFLREGWVGLDLDPDRLRYARLRSTRIVRADAHALPFAVETFDAVLAFRMLNAAGAIDAVLAEIRRVLRPAGTLLVLTLAGANDSQLRRVDDAVRRRAASTGDRLDEANGAERLSRWFANVAAERFVRQFRFDDAAAALDHYALQYLHRGDSDAAETLARFNDARERILRLPLPIGDEQRATLFVARG